MSQFLPNGSDMLRDTERTLLQLLQEREVASKAELARLSGMSAQGVAVIMDGLIERDFVLKGAKERGRVGQPSTPLRINPEGGFSIGIQLAPHATIGCLVDAAGNAVARKVIKNDLPVSETDEEGALTLIGDLLDTLGEPFRHRAVGVAISCRPEMMDKNGWSQGPVLRLGIGRGRSLGARIVEQYQLPVYFENATRAGCLAELRQEPQTACNGVLYIRLGYAVEAITVADGRLSLAPSSFGAMPLSDGQGCLNDVASLAVLRVELQAAGAPQAAGAASDFGDPSCKTALDGWAERASAALDHAIACAVSAVPVETVIIDSPLPKRVTSQFAMSARVRLASSPLSVTPTVRAGNFGADSVPTGAALLPLQHKFAVDPAVFGTLTQARAA